MDKLVLIIGVLLVVGIGYFAINAGSREPADTQTDSTREAVNTTDATDTMDDVSVPADEGSGLPEDLAGIHIMADGSVMLGNGEVLTDAEVLANGDIRLSDGRVVTPIMDMR